MIDDTDDDDIDTEVNNPALPPVDRFDDALALIGMARNAKAVS
jgi:hypothetical protein